MRPIPSFKQFQKLLERCGIIAGIFCILVCSSIWMFPSCQKETSLKYLREHSEAWKSHHNGRSQWPLLVRKVSVYCLGLAPVSTCTWQEIVATVMYKKQSIKNCQGIYVFISYRLKLLETLSWQVPKSYKECILWGKWKCCEFWLQIPWLHRWHGQVDWNPQIGLFSLDFIQISPFSIKFLNSR